MDYESILNRMRSKRDYFNSIDFPLIAAEFDLAARAIEELLNNQKGSEECEEKD